VLNADIIAKSAAEIAGGAGITAPENTKMLLVEGDMPLEDDLFAREKLSPVLTIYKYDKFEEGVEILRRLTDNCGTGHSCGIHTFNRDYIEYLGQNMRTSRIIVRQPQAAANGGAFFNGMPSTVTMGCGTWGNNITTENISCKHFINVTWLSEPIPMNRPADDAVWGDYFAKYGK
jgi:sulfoacetaldehyde dehydrogenase